MFNFSDCVCLQSREDRTAVVPRLCSCYGLSPASDDFKSLCHYCIYLVCSKFCLEKTNFQLNYILRERGWGLDTSPFSERDIIQHFFLALAFSFISFVLEDFEGLIQRLWRCIKTQGADHTPPVSSIKQNTDMAKFLGLLYLEWRERQWGPGSQINPPIWALYSPFPCSYQGIQISFSKPFSCPHPLRGLIHKNWLNIVVDCFVLVKGTICMCFYDQELHSSLFPQPKLPPTWNSQFITSFLPFPVQPSLAASSSLGS